QLLIANVLAYHADRRQVGYGSVKACLCQGLDIALPTTEQAGAGRPEIRVQIEMQLIDTAGIVSVRGHGNLLLFAFGVADFHPAKVAGSTQVWLRQFKYVPVVAVEKDRKRVV